MHGTRMFCRTTKVSFLLNLGVTDLPVHTAYKAQTLGSAKAEGKGGSLCRRALAEDLNMARGSDPLPAMCLVSDPKTLAFSGEAAFSCKEIHPA